MIDKALDALEKKVTPTNLEPPKKEKGKKDMIKAIPYDTRPRMYLDDKDFPTAMKYKAGDKVVLVVECEVTSVSTYDSLKNGKAEKSFSADLCVHAIADITGVK